jgi:hypothetical protein
MAKITGSEPAMPNLKDGWGHGDESRPGLSIRQHFASLAMQGLLAHTYNEGLTQTILSPVALEKIARQAVVIADLLIEKLNT